VVNVDIDMVDSEYYCCDSGIPEGMTIYNSRIGGNLVAFCATCTTIWGYWECACELVHDCHGKWEW